ncbi:MAG: class I SAM-dependent methyltransferase [Isosphaeraceae bacterium]
MSQVSLELRACPICLTRSRSRRFAEANIHWEALDHYAFASRKLPEYMHWRLSRCLDCDLLYADPAPSPDDLARLYEEAGFDSRKEAHHASRTYGRLLSRIVGRLPERKGAADIGTGDGAFLAELLDQGFEDVEGIEPSMAPIEAADASVRPLIRHGVFRADSFAAESKSLITCFQTIEHLSDPLSFCRHAWRALRPGGAIFLIGHNHRAISAKILGRKSPIFDIEHLQLFSPTSMRCLLGTAGFVHIETFPIFNRYPLGYWARLFPFPHRLKRRMLATVASLPMRRWVIPLPAGNLAAVAYK